jgi:hypothetical protein
MFLTRHVSLPGAAALFLAASVSAQFSQNANNSDANSAKSPSSLAALYDVSGSAPDTNSAKESSSLASLYGMGSAAKSGSAPATEGAGSDGGGRYSDSHRFFSADKIAIEAGGGFNAPIGHDTAYLTYGGNLTLGGGLEFNKRLSLLAEYQFIDDKLPASFIAASGNSGGGGNAHIWSLTLDPMVDLFPSRQNSIYVTGGGGFYRKLTSFTVQVCCDFYGYPVSETAAHFSSNQGGFNFGAGYSRRMGGVSGDGRMKLFGEVRYVEVFTPDYDAFTGSLPMGKTETVPFTVGLRW